MTFTVKSVLPLAILSLLSGVLADKYDDFNECLVSRGVEQKHIVLDKKSEAYNWHNFQWNLKKKMEPRGYVRVQGTKDVQSSVICGTQTNVSIVPRCGGHSYEKYSLNSNDHVVVDLVDVNSFSVDPKTLIADFGSGTLLGHAYYKLWKAGQYGIPAGSCPTVGISGHTLGGGYGFSSRKHGFMIDRVIEMEMVTVKGEVLTLNKDQNKDLFWALRGAGTGNYGIVTKFKIQAFDAKAKVQRLTLKYPFEQFNQVYKAWQEWAISRPNNGVTSVFRVNRYEGLTISSVIQMGSEKENDVYAEEIVKHFPANFDKNNYKEQMTFIEMIVQFGELDNLKSIDEIPTINSHIHTPFYFKAKSFYIAKRLNDKQIDAYKSLFENMPQKGYLLMDLQGGALDYKVNTETAFSHRQNNLYSIQLVNQADTLEVGDAGMPWINNFEAKLRKNSIVNQEAYFNYIDEDLDNSLVRFYGGNLNRLVDIKAKYDPTNYFSNNQSIPVTMKGINLNIE